MLSTSFIFLLLLGTLSVVYGKTLGIGKKLIKPFTQSILNIGH